MKCYDCGGKYLKKKGPIRLRDDVIGDYIVKNVEYRVCNQCGELLFPPDTLETIEAKEEERLKELLGKIPNSALISATKAAEILGKTRQALHQDRRIRRGFIHTVTIEGRRFYDKKSVELFKKTGDGRYPLATEAESTKNEYVFVAQNMTSTDVGYKEMADTPREFTWDKLPLELLNPQGYQHGH